MTNELSGTGSLMGHDVFCRAIAVAGALAECGTQELSIANGSSTQKVTTRSVDLPSLLVPGVVITCDQTTILIFADRVDWTTASIELATALRAASRG